MQRFNLIPALCEYPIQQKTTGPRPAVYNHINASMKSLVQLPAG